MSPLLLATIARIYQIRDVLQFDVSFIRQPQETSVLSENFTRTTIPSAAAGPDAPTLDSVELGDTR
jgi:hypothetical protein